MSVFDAIILGFVQGVTEFLPVSSSGHLKLVEYFLGLHNLDHYILFDLACHLGTLCAIIIVFFASIRRVLMEKSTVLWQVAIGTLPLFPLVLLMKPIKAVYADPSYLGFFFLATALILFAGTYLGKRAAEPVLVARRWRDAFYVGLWQAMAILPGVSRSGSTISGARLLGWEPKDAVTFSFLLAVPAILGGTVLELFKAWKGASEVAEGSYTLYVTGFIVSFVVGIAALRLLMIAAEKNRFSYFAWYCLLLGLATTVYFHL